jgi:hypothetical protein
VVTTATATSTATVFYFYGALYNVSHGTCLFFLILAEKVTVFLLLLQILLLEIQRSIENYDSD